MHDVLHPKLTTARLYTSRKREKMECTASKMFCAKKNKASNAMSAEN